MPSARHILIVNSRSVHQPVFVVGAPHSGADLIGRALKASPGFHVTIGQPKRAAHRVRLRPAAVHVPGPDASRRHGDQGCLRAGLAGHPEQLPGMHPRMPGRRGPGRGRGRAVRGTAGAGDVRGREPRSHLLRGSAHLRVSRRPDRPGHQGRPGRGGQHARRPGGDVLVPAELRERGHRVPQPLLRHRRPPRTATCGPGCPRPPGAHCAGAGPCAWPPGCTTACRPGS